MHSPTYQHENYAKLEWGCPYGTKFPRGNQFKLPSYARETILPNRARAYRLTDRQTDRRTDRVIPVYPLTSLRGV